MVNPLTQAELARRLGISTPMVCRLVARGMPLDEDGARAWRKTHMQPFRGKHDRIDRNPGRRVPPAPRVYSVEELVELAEGIADVMMDDEGRPEVFAEGLPHLRSVLCRLPDSAAQQVRLPLRSRWRRA